MKLGLTKEASDALARTPRRRRRAARVLRARRAGVTDPAALAAVWSGARMLRRKRVSNAPKPVKEDKRAPVLGRLLERTGAIYQRGDR